MAITDPIAIPMIAPRGTELPVFASPTIVTVETTPFASVAVIMRSVAVGIIFVITRPFSSVVSMVRPPIDTDCEEEDDEDKREDPFLGSELSEVRSADVGGSGSGSG